MSFDMEKWHTVAEQHIVAGVAVELAVALNAIHFALQKLSEASGVDLTDELADIHGVSRSMSERFRELTGYTGE